MHQWASRTICWAQPGSVSWVQKKVLSQVVCTLYLERHTGLQYHLRAVLQLLTKSLFSKSSGAVVWVHVAGVCGWGVGVGGAGGGGRVLAA